MGTDLIKNKGENIRFNLVVFLHTVVPIGITVFLFSTKYNLNIYISTLFTYKDEYKSFIIGALGNEQVRYFFARNCEICCIRGPPVLFEI